MAQLMLLPLTVSCFSKIQIGFSFLVPAHLGSPGKRAVKRVRVCVCVTAHVKVCHLAYDISTPYGQDRPVCDVLIVCRQHSDKQWKFNAQHAKRMW